MLLDRRHQVNRFLDVERQAKGLIVFGPDANRVLIADDVDILRLEWKTDGVGEQPKTILDLLIRSTGREPTLLAHRITKPIVIEKILPRIHSEVDHSGE